MSKINLLPWRDELKKIKNQIFYFTLVSLVGASVLVTIMIDGYLNYKLSVKNANIQYINKELKNAQTKVTEVQSLKRNKQQLLERINIIQSLQADRPSAVKLLDVIPRVLPEGIYLVDLSRKDAKIEVNTASQNVKDKTSNPNVNEVSSDAKKYTILIQGVALTNGSISVFLKKLEAIKWVSEVKLDEVSINKDGDGLNFKLDFIQNLEDRE